MLALVHENLSSCMGIDHMESEWRTHMMHPAAVKPNKIALFAKIMVAKYLGFLYTASKYTFSPPERGNIVPYSSHTKRPKNDSRKPRTHNMREAPTEPTELRMEGVENIPVPIIRPTLNEFGMMSIGR